MLRDLVVGEERFTFRSPSPATGRHAHPSVTSVPAATIELAPMWARSAESRPSRSGNNRQWCNRATARHARPSRCRRGLSDGSGSSHERQCRPGCSIGAQYDAVHVARITTVIHTLLSSPISTSPMTCALWSMKAVGWTRGRRRGTVGAFPTIIPGPLSGQVGQARQVGFLFLPACLPQLAWARAAYDLPACLPFCAPERQFALTGADPFLRGVGPPLKVSR